MVDKELRVYGKEIVRVVDASVLPLQISRPYTSMLYAVAERISEIVRVSSGQNFDHCFAD